MTTLPDRYREVSVTDVDVPLEPGPLTALLRSRPVYRRTRFVVARRGAETALAEVRTATSIPLFCPVTEATLLAGPDETEYLHRPELDTAVPGELARAAADVPDARCVVVEGRYGHVSFVLDPAPVRLHVLDVAPPWPAKLLDQVERVLATADDLPPMLPVPRVVALPDLLPAEAAGHYLLPCRGGGMEVPGATVSYLDEVPPAADWTLLGCARSREIHDHFYECPVPQIDTCPRALSAAVEPAPGEALITKCCLLETRVETEGRSVVVPWGASFAELRHGLAEAARLARS